MKNYLIKLIMNDDGHCSSELSDGYDNTIFSSAKRFSSIKNNFDQIEKELNIEYRTEIRNKDLAEIL